MRYDLRLDALNFLLADVRGGLGPYVGMFLLGQAHWDQATIGVVLTMSGLVGITLHTPVGALIDATHRKRELLVAGVAALAASALAIAATPVRPVVLAADIVMAVLGAVFAPTVAAITVGLVARGELTARLARNAAWDRAGNIFVGVVAGLAGWAFSSRAVLYLAPFFALLTAVAALSIPARAIDHARARGLDGERAASGRAHPAGWRILLHDRPLLMLAAGVALFHFANAPMLLLVGQELTLGHPGEATVLMSACIVTAQLVSIPAALVVGAEADRRGRKPLLLAAFAALPARCLLFAAVDRPFWLVAGQILDGVALGMLDALLALVLADVMRGTGRYNLARGLVGTVQGIGGSSSNAVAGLLVVWAGYPVTFLVLALVALAAFLLMALAMPETGNAVPPGTAGLTAPAPRPLADGPRADRPALRSRPRAGRG
ncbi:MFS transporter [Benzoatithermus flavus]|uniref:MFS transporter n=1 Tax=Benzoatithermus flavus TaxID=3108223 RepID=A0ABU8XPR5_9PROT